MKINLYFVTTGFNFDYWIDFTSKIDIKTTTIVKTNDSYYYYCFAVTKSSDYLTYYCYSYWSYFSFIVGIVGVATTKISCFNIG